MVQPRRHQRCRFNKFGVVDVNYGRRYNKFEFDPNNCEYEDLIDDMVDEAKNDEFEESDDKCSDDNLKN